MAARPGLARTTLLGFRADAVSAVSAVAAAIIVARGLGPADRGAFFLAFLAATLIALLADCGMSATSIVYGSNREIPSRQLHGAAALFSTFAAVLAAVVLLPFEGFWTGGVLKGLDTAILTMVCIGTFPVLYGQIIGALLTGMGYVPEVSLMRIAQAVLYPALIAPAAFSGDPRWAVAAWLATVLAFAAGVAAYAVRYAGTPARPTPQTIRRIVSFGSRSYVGSLSHQGFLRVDVLFLSGRYGPGVVGVYSLASIVAERIGMVGHAMYNASAAPVGKGGGGAAELTAATVRLILTMLVPLAVVLALGAGPGFRFVFGDRFEDAALPFVILLPGTVSLAVWALVSLYIISALRRPGATALIQGGALVTSLPLYYWAVREAEMTGAAIVSSVTYTTVLVAGLALLLRNSHLRFTDLVPGPAEPARLVALLRQALRRSEKDDGP